MSRRFEIMALSWAAAAAVALAVAAPALATPPSLDPYGYCQLRAYVPNLDGSSYEVQGSVTCYTASGVDLQVCAQVVNSGDWYTVSGSCAPSDSGYYSWASTADTGLQGKWESGVCGHTYRTWDQGADSWYGVWINNHSSSETQCS